MTAEVISPVAIGLISDPPTIVVSYDHIAGHGQKRKRRKRKMPLRDFTDRSNVKRYAFNLRQRHNKYLENVIDVTLEKLLRMIQEIQKGHSVEVSLEVVNKEYSIDPNEDLNKLSPAQLAQRKAMMDEMFHQNLVKPDDPEFVYDKVIEFQVEQRRKDNAEGEMDEWDDDSCKNAEKVKEPEPSSVPVEKVAESDVRMQFKTEILPEYVVPPTNDQSRLDLIEENDKHNDEEENGQIVNSNGKHDSSILPLFQNEEKVRPQFALGKSPLLDSYDTVKKLDDESSNNDIEEALVDIESGVLEDEEEDFWQ